jgi:hypothetical protein
MVSSKQQSQLSCQVRTSEAKKSIFTRRHTRTSVRATNIPHCHTELKQTNKSYYFDNEADCHTQLKQTNKSYYFDNEADCHTQLKQTKKSMPNESR